MAAPDQPEEEAIPTLTALVRQHTEVSAAPKAREHPDATLVPLHLLAATVLLQLLQSEHKMIEWWSMFRFYELLEERLPDTILFPADSM